ncbi:Chitin binding domain [Trinorchestia longiramus]|nr:Chitin binding domain [Trinorchestia longiramus]
MHELRLLADEGPLSCAVLLSVVLCCSQVCCVALRCAVLLSGVLCCSQVCCVALRPLKLLVLLLLTALSAAQAKSLQKEILTTWDGRPVNHVPVSLTIERASDSALSLVVHSPFYKDPAPPRAVNNSNYIGLWDYEVVELFFLNDADQYLQIEIAPRGQYFVMLFDGVRNYKRYSLPLRVMSRTGEEPSPYWTATIVLPTEYLPHQVTKFNMYSTHGEEPDRVYEAYSPSPAPAPGPDYHRLEAFAPIHLDSVIPGLSERPRSQLWTDTLASRIRYELETTWNGSLANQDPTAVPVSVLLESEEDNHDELILTARGPSSGGASDDVLRAFFLNNDDLYLEAQFGPGSSNLDLTLWSRSNEYHHLYLTLPLHVVSSVNETSWTAVARIPADYLPPKVSRFNAYFIPASGDAPLALYPQPSSDAALDVHALQHYLPLDLNSALPRQSQRPMSLIWVNTLQGIYRYTIRTEWNDIPITDRPLSTITLEGFEAGVEMNVTAPFFNDPAPEGPPGKPQSGLFNYEVVEMFFLNDNDEYLEVNLGPWGQHLVLLVKGVRTRIAKQLPLDYIVTARTQGTGGQPGQWQGSALIPPSYFPPNVTRMNAFAIHGPQNARIYEALYPAPRDHPQYSQADFHLLKSEPDSLLSASLETAPEIPLESLPEIVKTSTVPTTEESVTEAEDPTTMSPVPVLGVTQESAAVALQDAALSAASAAAVQTTTTASLSDYEYEIKTEWNGKAIEGRPFVSFNFKGFEAGVELNVTAPFFNDPVTDSESFNIENFHTNELFEVYFINDNNEYLQLMLSPWGNYAVILFKGEKKFHQYGVPLDFIITQRDIGVHGNPGEWRGSALVPPSFFPPNVTRMNAAAQHGHGDLRVYELLYPAPADSTDYPGPDFHRLELSKKLEFAPLVLDNTQYSQLWLDALSQTSSVEHPPHVPGRGTSDLSPQAPVPASHHDDTPSSATLVSSAQTTSVSPLSDYEYEIKTEWNGKAIEDRPFISFNFNKIEAGLEIEVTAPFFNDAAPTTTLADLSPSIHQYEVFEVYFANDQDQYLQIMLNPWGFRKAMLYDGVRTWIQNGGVEFNFSILQREFGKGGRPGQWRGSALVPPSFFPPNVTRMNAAAQHGHGDLRVYELLYPAPADSTDYPEPDFHRLELFKPLDFTALVSDNTQYSQLWLDAHRRAASASATTLTPASDPLVEAELSTEQPAGIGIEPSLTRSNELTTPSNLFVLTTVTSFDEDVNNDGIQTTLSARADEEVTTILPELSTSARDPDVPQPELVKAARRQDIENPIGNRFRPIPDRSAPRTPNPTKLDDEWKPDSLPGTNSLSSGHSSSHLSGQPLFPPPSFFQSHSAFDRPLVGHDVGQQRPPNTFINGRPLAIQGQAHFPLPPEIRLQQNVPSTHAHLIPQQPHLDHLSAHFQQQQPIQSIQHPQQPNQRRQPIRQSQRPTQTPLSALQPPRQPALTSQPPRLQSIPAESLPQSNLLGHDETNEIVPSRSSADVEEHFQENDFSGATSQNAARLPTVAEVQPLMETQPISNQTNEAIIKPGVTVDPVVKPEEHIEFSVNPEQSTEPLLEPGEPIEPLIKTEEPIEPLIKTEEPIEPLIKTEEPIEPLIKTEEPLIKPEQPIAPLIEPAQPIAPLIEPAQPIPAQPIAPLIEPARPIAPLIEPAQPIAPLIEPAQPIEQLIEPAQPIEPLIPAQSQKAAPLQPLIRPRPSGIRPSPRPSGIRPSPRPSGTRPSPRPSGTRPSPAPLTETNVILPEQRPKPNKIGDQKPSAPQILPKLKGPGEVISSEAPPRRAASVPPTAIPFTHYPPPHDLCMEQGLYADPFRCPIFHECVLENNDWQVYTWRCPRGKYFDDSVLTCVVGYC